MKESGLHESVFTSPPLYGPWLGALLVALPAVLPRGRAALDARGLGRAGLAAGGAAIKRPSPLHALKDIYDHSCY